MRRNCNRSNNCVLESQLPTWLKFIHLLTSQNELWILDKRTGSALALGSGLDEAQAERMEKLNTSVDEEDPCLLTRSASCDAFGILLNVSNNIEPPALRAEQK